MGPSDRFLHVMAFADEVAQERHQNAAYTMQFVEALYPSCAEMPTFTTVHVIE